jgi:aspartate aminotransferase
MSEEAARLRALRGPDAVFDFSLGNPNTEPPEEFPAVIEDLMRDPAHRLHGYMPNAGFPEARRAVAEWVSGEQGVAVPPECVVMTCGAAGALNVILRTVLDPGDEVIVSRPYFVEYGFYAENHGGVLRPVPSTADFDLDLAAIEEAIDPRTRAVVINSPNNPTGRVYPAATLAGLGALLERKSRETGRTIFLVSDEPYRKIVYDGVEVPTVLGVYPYTLVVSSYSKELSLAGERIGYLAAGPSIPQVERLMEGLIMANRILGFVNAPALMQRAVVRLQGACVDLSVYRRNREVLLQALRGAGYAVPEPQGGFYLFPRSPIEDDVAFAMALAEQGVIVVPGTGFGYPGHFRLSYCVSPRTVDGALPALCAAGERRETAASAGMNEARD